MKWTRWSEELFGEIKKTCSIESENRMPNVNDSFIFIADASLIEIGAVMKQGYKSIAYVSSIIKGAENNYTVMVQETLAALWAMISWNSIWWEKSLLL